MGRTKVIMACVETVTPQPMTGSSGRDTRRIRLLKRIHNNYLMTIIINMFIIPTNKQLFQQTVITEFTSLKQKSNPTT
ncbi:hypothetical protein Hdeb2414_s0005g00154761 [Helianthus debilis subsp. tardiflorus]